MQKKHKMHDFWDRIGNMIVKYEDDLCSHNGVAKGYLEIESSNGIIYRSLPPDEYNVIIWVSWKPFRTIYHFSCLTDPGTIKWIKNGDADKPCGD